MIIAGLCLSIVSHTSFALKLGACKKMFVAPKKHIIMATAVPAPCIKGHAISALSLPPVNLKTIENNFACAMLIGIIHFRIRVKALPVIGVLRTHRVNLLSINPPGTGNPNDLAVFSSIPFGPLAIFGSISSIRPDAINPYSKPYQVSIRHRTPFGNPVVPPV